MQRKYVIQENKAEGQTLGTYRKEKEINKKVVERFPNGGCEAQISENMELFFHSCGHGDMEQ